MTCLLPNEGHDHGFSRRPEQEPSIVELLGMFAVVAVIWILVPIGKVVYFFRDRRERREAPVLPDPAEIRARREAER